jgi:hypothetical protein
MKIKLHHDEKIKERVKAFFSLQFLEVAFSHS